MLVVIPCYAKDAALAEANVSWCLRMEPGGTPFHCLIAAEEGTQTGKLVDLASKWFARVVLWTYPVHPGPPEWPRPQNYSWQTVARYLSHATHPDSWFWWEADVTPLHTGWLNALAAEHQHGGKPFTGRIGEQGLGGVAIYPPNVLEYSTNALLVRAEAWDSALSRDAKNHFHPANHLMAHFPRYSRVVVHVEDPAVPELLKKRGYAVFHGCNDGSLVALLEGRTPSKPTLDAIVRTYTVEDVDRDHNLSEPMWQYDAFELRKRGYPVLPFSECSKSDIPSVVTQAKNHGWKAGFFSLPHTPSEVHYNAGLVRIPGGPLALVTRRWLRAPTGTWKSDMARWKLDENMAPVEPLPLQVIPRDSAATYEDPRVVFHDGRYWVSYCVWRQGRLFRSHQAVTTYNLSWQPLATMNVPYGGNGWHTGSGTAHEKNWIWFWHDKAWHFVYQAHPHIVVRVDEPSMLKDYKPPGQKTVHWPYGEIHGGTPPVRVGDEYVTFFHSSMAWQGRRKRYYMGAYAFQAKPPFSMTRLTREPLLIGSDKDPRTLGGPLCVFPCGSVLENGEWTVSIGVNDEATACVTIPQKDLDKRMEKL